MKKVFTKVPVTRDYYANWASGFKLPKTSLQLSIVDDVGKVVAQWQVNKTQYNTAADMKRMLNHSAKNAGY
jgi:hypothetical protein